MNLALPYKDKSIFYTGSLLFLVSCILAFYFQSPFFCLLPLGLIMAIFFLIDIRIPFYLLMFSIPLSFNLEDYIHFGVDFPDEPIMIILAVFFLFFALLNKKNFNWSAMMKNPLLILVLLSFCWLLITVIYSKNPSFSSKYLIKRIWYLLPFLFLPVLIFQEQRYIQKAFVYMFLPLFLIVISVLIRFSAYGFQFEDVYNPIQPFFINHVIYGSMISCFVPLIVGALFIVRKFSFAWLILLTAVVVFFVGIYFSYSRAAWMAILFAFVAWICIHYKIMQYLIILLYAVLLSAIIWLSVNNEYLKYRPNFERTIMHQSLSDHILATIQGTDISSAERYYRWIAAIRMSVDNPITGVGPNNFYDYYKPYAINSYKTWVSRNSEKSTTHNYFLFMLVEQGYPALILYALLILLIFSYGQQLFHRLKDKTNKVMVLSCLCMIAALFVNNFFSELLETDKIGSLFLLGIAVIVAIDIKDRSVVNEQDTIRLNS